MRFTVPFLLAIAVYIATVLGANQTSFTPNEDMLYDVVSASDAIAFRLERAIGLAEKPALIIGALLLTLPALLTFHLFRIGFGGSIQSLIQNDHLSRQIAREQEQVQAARYAAASGATVYEGETLTRSRAGDGARPVGNGKSSGNDERRSGKERRDKKERRRGIGANIAAALKSRKEGKSTSTTVNAATSGTTSINASTSDEAASAGRGLKDRWAGVLDSKPDFTRLKSSAQGLRSRLGSTAAAGSASTKLSLDDLAEEVSKKSGD